MSRRFPYWRVTAAGVLILIVVCLLAGAGVANASDTGDGSGGCYTVRTLYGWSTLCWTAQP